MYSAPDGETYFRMPALPAFVRLGEERNGGRRKDGSREGRASINVVWRDLRFAVRRDVQREVLRAIRRDVQRQVSRQ
jgi:hypothetical protein